MGNILCFFLRVLTFFAYNECGSENGVVTPSPVLTSCSVGEGLDRQSIRSIFVITNQNIATAGVELRISCMNGSSNTILLEKGNCVMDDTGSSLTCDEFSGTNIHACCQEEDTFIYLQVIVPSDYDDINNGDFVVSTICSVDGLSREITGQCEDNASTSGSFPIDCVMTSNEQGTITYGF